MHMIHHLSRQLSIPFVLITALCFSPMLSAQFGDALIIDQEESAMGITGMATADLNNDGFLDLVTSNGYNQGRVTVYLNNTGDLLGASPVVIDADAPFVEGVATTDLDQDGWMDVVAIARLEGTLVWYRNTNGSFGQRTVLDSARSMLNAVVAGDVDGDGAPDLVMIGQHSIDLFRNDGSGAFTKEAILTTETSPNILECMDLVLVDIDGDGDLDPVTGETIGPVIYENDGTGTFTPRVLDPQPAVRPQIKVHDLDGDGDTDIVVLGPSGTARWYRNEGASWTNVADILPGISIRNFDLFDADGDGLADAITARGSQVYYHQGLGDGTFAAEEMLFAFDAVLMDEVATADLNNDGRPDVLWSAPAGFLTYHLNTLPTAVPTRTAVRPCMASRDGDGLQLRANGRTDDAVSWEVTDVQGRSIWQHTALAAPARIPLQGMEAGTYVAIGRGAQSGCALRFVVH